MNSVKKDGFFKEIKKTKKGDISTYISDKEFGVDGRGDA
jgi:hypothetical protein